jgi:hypothetical protein
VAHSPTAGKTWPTDQQSRFDRLRYGVSLAVVVGIRTMQVNLMQLNSITPTVNATDIPAPPER